MDCKGEITTNEYQVHEASRVGPVFLYVLDTCLNEEELQVGLFGLYFICLLELQLGLFIIF